MYKRIRQITRIALVSVLLVVLAGSVVRMTGSGMGCPDWPKCFGYLIPPTDEATVTWESGRTYRQGQMIVMNDELLSARMDFTTGEAFDTTNWELYEQHDYAIFNVAHTWTEYINRLIGAFSGIPVLLLFVLAAWRVRKDPLLFLYSASALFMLGFVAWLGKVVVDSNLTENKISLHMAGALSIVGLLVLALRQAGAGNTQDAIKGKLQWVLLVLALAGLAQIFLGTQVREEIDMIAKSGVAREDWVSQVSSIFPIHRSFAWIVVILTGGMYFLARRSGQWRRGFSLITGLVALEILAGIVLSYLGMPAILQPLHLLAAFLLFALSLFQLLPPRKQLPA